MTLARDVHLGRLLGVGRPPRGAALEGVRVYASRPDATSRSRARSTCSASRPRRSSSSRRTSASGSAARRSPRPSRGTGRPGSRRSRIAAVAGSTNTGLGRRRRRAGRRRRGRGAVAPRRRGVRRRGPPVRPRRRPGAGPRARRLGHGRPAQVVLPGLRHRRPAGARRRRPRRRPSARVARVLPRRRDAGSGRDGDRRRRPRRRPRDQLNFYKLGFEGTRRWRALKLWMSWKHLGTDGFGRLIEANDDLAALPRRAAAPRPTTSRRCPESRTSRSSASATCPAAARRALALPPAELDAHQDRLQRALEVSGDGWLTTTRLRGSTWLRAGIVNYLSTRGHRPPARDAATARGRGGLTGRCGSHSARASAGVPSVLESVPLADDRQEPRSALVRRRHEREA